MYGWPPSDRHQVGKGGAVNWNEGLHSWYRGEVETVASTDKGMHEKRGDAVVFAGLAAAGLALAILYQFMLRNHHNLPIPIDDAPSD